MFIRKLLTISLSFVVLLSFSSLCFSQPEAADEGKKFQKPQIVPHSKWQKEEPVGFPAEGKRKNIAPKENIKYKDLTIELISMTAASDDNKDAKNKAELKLIKGDKTEHKTVNSGDAFNFGDYHIAVIAIHAKKGELGAGLTEFEICTIASIPPEIANSETAGDAKNRARIKHEIKMVTLHHAGDPKPMMPEDDPIKKLQGLQSWGMRDKNWWDLPYHFLISIDGTIYEGRDYHYVGETNTKYDPEGHFLISVMDDLQEPTPAQIKSITDLMAWAIQENKLSIDKIYGHCDFADTGCPGKNLKPLLKDGSFTKGVKERLGIK